MNNKFIAVLSALCLVSISLLAQPSGPPPTPLPIDGGLGILLAGCVGYGVKTMRNKKK